jgi:predicted transglutaminase-like cysteine proteinase
MINTPGRRMGALPRLLAVAVMAALALAAAGAPADAARTKQTKYPPIFGSKETQYYAIRKFKKWTGALDRFLRGKARLKLPCDPKPYANCGVQFWRKLIKEIVGEDRLEQIIVVNDYMNKARYVRDPPNWNVKDYWETPFEFFDKQGDCEDYAIIKYLTLKALGFKQRDMRIVVVKDLNLRVGHAVLVVYHKGRPLVLDNQTDKVVDAKRIRHYRARYSINEKYWWSHRY